MGKLWDKRAKQFGSNPYYAEQIVKYKIEQSGNKQAEYCVPQVMVDMMFSLLIRVKALTTIIYLVCGILLSRYLQFLFKL